MDNNELLMKAVLVDKNTRTVLPNPLQDLIIDYLGGDIDVTNSIYNANYVCTLFEGGSKQKPYDKLALSILMRHVVSGEQLQAEAILKVNPPLLFKTSHVKDLAGNTFIQYSPVSLACFAHDNYMLEMMQKYVEPEKFIHFKKLIQESLNTLNKHKPYDFSEIVAAITAGGDDQIMLALDKFYSTMRPRNIKNEKSFNILNLVSAYEAYINNYYPWTAEQCSFFWCKVVGFCQRMLPACYASAFCQGLGNIIENKNNFLRHLILHSGDHFYDEGLGETFAIYSNQLSIRDDCMQRHEDGWDRVKKKSYPLLLKHIAEKKQSLQSLLLKEETCEPAKSLGAWV